jgi:hypothetical protein
MHKYAKNKYYYLDIILHIFLMPNYELLKLFQELIRNGEHMSIKITRFTHSAKLRNQSMYYDLESQQWNNISQNPNT